MKKLLALFLSIAMLAGCLVGCAAAPAAQEAAAPAAAAAPAEPAAPAAEPAAPASEAPAETVFADTVVTAYHEDMDTADPYGSTASSTAIYTNATHRVLIKNDYDTGEMVGVLAESWEDASNGAATAWRIKLKEGIKFHDGSDFNAEDVVFTWNYAKTVDNVVAPINNAEAMVKEVTAEDDYTVLFTLNSAIPDFPNYLEIKILSKEAYDTMDPKDAALIGCGPYKAGARTSGVSWELDRFDDYFEGIDNYPSKKIIVKVLADMNTTAAALETGDVDFLFAFDLTLLDLFKGNDNFVIESKPGFMSYYIGFGYRNEQWNDVELRKAVAMAIDRDTMNLLGYNGTCTPNYNFCVPAGKGYDPNVKTYELDPAGAKAILESKGKLGMEVKVMANATQRSLAESVQSMLDAAGFKTVLDYVDGANWTTLKATSDYDLFIGDYCTYSGALLRNFNRFFTDGGTSNMFGFVDPAWEALIKEANEQTTYDDMLEVFDRMQVWAAENVPIVPVLCSTSYFVYAKNVFAPKLAPSYTLMELEYLYKTEG